MRDLEVGKRIRLVREKLDLTQAQFAKRLGVIPVSVARYEAGRVPRTDVLDKICRIGGVTTAWLLHGDTEKRTARHAGPPTENVAHDELVREILSLLRPDWASRRWAKLPLGYRARYEERAKDASGRLRRELDEYRKLLELEFRVDRRRRPQRE